MKDLAATLEAVLKRVPSSPHLRDHAGGRLPGVLVALNTVTSVSSFGPNTNPHSWPGRPGESPLFQAQKADHSPPVTWSHT